MNVITPLNMSHLIHSDAPLSPLSDWDHTQQYSPTSLEFPPSLHYGYAPMPSPTRSVGSTSSGSPIPVSRVLRGRMSPEDFESEQQLCLPTHQVFDMTYAPSPDVFSSSPESVQESLPPVQSTVSSVVPCKRSSSVTPSASKKPRASVSTKDFVPPDVTGLSKREARLVKNRAAAFLSRQRKREEFEHMEHRVAELEQENARLLALAQGGGSKAEPQHELLSEVEQLRAQLAAAQKREQELSEALSHKASRTSPVKSETVEPQLSVSPTRNPSQLLHKSSASLGLMVLLCALPTLLSLPTHSTVPTTLSLPNAVQAASSAFDMNSFVPGDFDWFSSSGSVMDLDIDSQGRITPGSVDPSNLKKLEFVDADAEALGLSGLDISFDATPSQDGKIRVRIHPPSSTSSSDMQSNTIVDDDQSMWGGSDMGSSTGTSPGSYADPDPFLGVGGDYGMIDSSAQAIFAAQPPAFDYELGAGYGSRRRVRIALKSMPGEGREGGEWEVQLC